MKGLQEIVIEVFKTTEYNFVFWSHILFSLRKNTHIHIRVSYQYYFKS